MTPIAGTGEAEKTSWMKGIRIIAANNNVVAMITDTKCVVDTCEV